MTDNVTIPYTQYRSFFENSAAHFGQLDARQTAHLGAFHPGDNIGRLLSRVWTVDPDDAGLAFAAYLVALNNECDRLEVSRPGLKKISSGLPLSVNENEFPDVDVTKMVDAVTREAPGYYSEAV